MPNKLQAYAEQAERTARQITGSHLAWTAFLTTAARLYKYPYNEQLMIYMQRPEATACAEYDFWNEKMGRYVRRGSTGIALIDATGYKPRLKYVFDVSDTGGKENARRVNLWELKDAHTDSVSAMLERNYGVSGKTALRSSSRASLLSLLRNTGATIPATSSASLRIPIWRSMMITTSRWRSKTPRRSASPTPSCPAAGCSRRITLNTRIFQHL